MITLCEPFGIDLSTELITTQIEASRRAEAILRERGADLLLFGKVLSDDSLHIWTVNDHGGCHFSPDPIVLKNGAMPGEFQKETKNKLIGVTLTNIAAACDRQAEEINWQLLEGQLVKLGNLLRSAGLNLPEDQLVDISLAYYNGINRVYFNGVRSEWLEEGLLFSKAEANAESTGNFRKAQAWLFHGKFSYIKSKKSGDKKDLEAALSAYSRSLQISPGADAFRFRADAFSEIGDHQQAIRDLDQAIRLKPDDPKLVRYRAVQYSMAGNHERAIRDLDQLVRLNPDDPTLIQGRAIAYSKVGNYERAIRDYDEAIRLKPNDPTLLNDRCYELAKIGRLALALSDCNRALALRPDFAYALDSRGFVYLRLGQFDSAISDYDAALKLSPKSAESLYGRGLAKMRKGQTQKAKEDIAAAKAIKPDIAGEFARYGLK